jgi:hypothetical protein
LLAQRAEISALLKHATAGSEGRSLATPNTPASGNTPRPDFIHVAKNDGTSSSICLRCHAVVASSHNEYSLEQAERAHVCAHPADPKAALIP